MVQRTKNNLRAALILTVLLFGTLAVFWRVSDAEFVNFDDLVYVAWNPMVQEGLTTQSVKWAFSSFHFRNYHPLTYLSYMADYELFGLHPGFFHLVNLGWHVANTLILFLVLRGMTGETLASAMVAAVFAWHPLHVESVAWISERKDVLSTFFWLLTVWAYANYARGRNAGWYAGMIIFFICGLMSKAMLVTLPFVLLLLDVWPLRRVEIGANKWWNETRRLVVEKLPLFALAGVASYLAFLAQGDAVRSASELNLWQRIGNAVVAYARYLGKTFWPNDLAVFYPYPPAGWSGAQLLSAMVLVTGLSVLAFAMVRRRPYFFTGWFWFAGTLVPVIGLVQIGSQSMADRYMYVPLIGLAIVVVWGVRDLVAAGKLPKVAAMCAAAGVVLLCAAISFRQVAHWKNSLTLFTRAEQVTAPNIITLNNTIDALRERGRTNEARERISTALRVFPHEPVTWWHVATRALEEGKTAEAAEHCRKGLRLDPENAELNLLMGSLLEQNGKAAEAIPHLERSIRGRPDSAAAHRATGIALARLGNFAGARKHLDEAIRLNPRDAVTRVRSGMLWGELSETQNALSEYREALRLDPNAVLALNNLAWVLATHPRAELRNGKEAVTLAERACQLTGRKLAPLLGTLAAAYAETGDFAKAVTIAGEAIKLAEANAQTEVLEKNRELLKHYANGQPWREPERKL